MSKCAICKKEVGFMSVNIDENIQAHIDCFYEDIPNASKTTDKERRKAINNKVMQLVRENAEEKSEME